MRPAPETEIFRCESQYRNNELSTSECDTALCMHGDIYSASSADGNCFRGPDSAGATARPSTGRGSSPFSANST